MRTRRTPSRLSFELTEEPLSVDAPTFLDVRDRIENLAFLRGRELEKLIVFSSDHVHLEAIGQRFTLDDGRPPHRYPTTEAGLVYVEILSEDARSSAPVRMLVVVLR